jgi:hypothetical protein
MLPVLQKTDIFLTSPDVSGINIFSAGFSTKSIPKGVGVYCFYDPPTGVPHYIGSGGSHDFGSKGGVRQRMLDYRTSTSKHAQGMRVRIATEGLRLKVWLTTSIGDARKYEHDAIDLYQPCMNAAGCRRESEQNFRKRNNEKQRAFTLRRKETQVFNPSALRHCNKCHLPKTCVEFRRNSYKLLGTVETCKVCEALLRKQQKGAKESIDYENEWSPVAD